MQEREIDAGRNVCICVALARIGFEHGKLRLLAGTLADLDGYTRFIKAPAIADWACAPAAYCTALIVNTGACDCFAVGGGEKEPGASER